MTSNVERPEDVWKHVSLACHCAWEVEHGLQLVFTHGSAISKVGPFDDETLRGVVYVRIADQP